MLAYAASRPRTGARQSSPNALLVVIAIHVALIAVVMSAKMDLPERILGKPIVVDFVPPPPAPPKRTADQPRKEQMQPRELSLPRQNDVKLPPQQPSFGSTDATPKLPDIGDLLGTGQQPQPRVEPKPLPIPAPTSARLLTPPSELKPPYPESKILTGEEAVLTLRLSIDAQGRVSSVEPVGRADRAFLEAARRHLIAHWRYKPATQGGQAVASVITITLRFQLDG